MRALRLPVPTAPAAPPRAHAAVDRRRLPRWLLLAVLGLGVAALVATVLRPAPVRIEVAAVSRGRLVATLDEEAETRVVERFVVSAPVAGTVARLALHAGDPVVAGETVLVEFVPSVPALIDPRTRAELGARLSGARAERERAAADSARLRAELAQAERTLARTERLTAAGAMAPERLEADRLATATLRQSAAAAAAAERAADALVAGVRASLSSPASAAGMRLRLRAPADGVVLRVFQESEAAVGPGTPLIEVGDPVHLEVVADLLSSDAVALAPGQAALFDNWGGDHAVAGRVARIEPAAFTKVSALGVDEQRVKVVFAAVDPPAEWRRLGDRYRLTVRVVVADVPDTWKVPASSLARAEDGWGVYVIDGDRARWRPVEIGPRNDREAAVVRGLRGGEQVAAYLVDALADGVRVQADD